MSAIVTPSFAPLAARMRPRHLDEVLGQSHLLGSESVLRKALQQKRPYSMILWGPPGCGKTTLANLIADASAADFFSLSAVLAGVAELRQAVKAAKDSLLLKRRTVLFIDEIHRFNKAQQDALLPHVEDGSVILVGATTENPSFAINGALLSRARVHVLKAVPVSELINLLLRALNDRERGLAAANNGIVPTCSAAALQMIAESADGDARRALTLLEVATELAEQGRIDVAQVAAASGSAYRRFDKHGDLHSDQISALHKTIRNSNPDAALYWLCRMLDGGVDPNFIARRLTRAASEDIGNADPRALPLAIAAWQAYERLGTPEGELALAQATLYLASAAKSNASYTAYQQASALVQEQGTAEVPNHLRNAPTKLMKSLGYGAEYQYDHDFPEAFVPAQTGFPDGMEQSLEFYQPVPRGLESKIAEKLAWLRSERRAAYHHSEREQP